MTEISILFVTLVLIGCLLGIIAIWSRRKLWVRVFATLIFLAFSGTGLFALVDLLSRPKPTYLEIINKDIDEALVLAVNVEEGIAIYVWLKFPNFNEPRAYAYPWNLEMASELKKAIKQANDDRTQLRMRQPFDPSNEIRKAPRFYSLPPERLPLKPESDPLKYQHPSISA